MYNTVYFPKRELLSFLKVLLLPKHSNSGLQLIILVPMGMLWTLFRASRILMMKDKHLLVLSVFPAPDSPDMQMAWF